MENNKRAIDRLQEYIKKKKITVSTFEKSIGVSNGFINKISKGAGNLNSTMIYDIHKVYKDLNIWWLISGTGDMQAQGFAVIRDIPVTKEVGSKFEKQTLPIKKSSTPELPTGIDDTLKFLMDKVLEHENILKSKKKK